VETVNTSFNIMPYRISDPLKFNPKRTSVNTELKVNLGDISIYASQLSSPYF